MWRTIAAVIGMSGLVATSASAGVIGFFKETFPPLPAESLPGHRLIHLQTMTDDGSFVSAVDIRIHGQLHQRWPFDFDTGVFVPSPSSSNNFNTDSHFTPISGALVGSPLIEDNISQSPLPDTATRDYGYGSFLQGAWGIPGPSQSTKAGLAYIVIPNGTEATLEINIQVATSNGTYSLIGPQAFGLVAVPEPPTLALAALSFLAIFRPIRLQPKSPTVYAERR